MKTGLASGCLAWFVLFGIISSCLVPVALMTAGFSASSNFAIDTMGGYMCPPETTPQAYTYQTTIWDSDLNAQRGATAYELICVDANGETVVNLGPNYAFIWTAVFGAGAALLAVLLSLLFAGPIGVFIGKRWGRKPQSAIGG
jgi:hypothetical protein